jgi:alpha-1,6-mannosyltransferase
VLFFPVVQPWYLLWAIVPLATWATRPGFRGTAITLSLVVGIFGPTANGDRFTIFQILDATVASLLIAVILIAVTWRRLPWRPLPDANGTVEPEATDASGPPTTAPPGPTATKPDAYAESP